MKAYKDLFVDFDDTLYDTHGNAVIALRETFDAFNLAQYFDNPQTFYDAYWTANIDQWTRYSKEEITRDYLIVERFRRPLSEGRGLDVTEKMCREIDAKGTKLDIILNNAGLQIAYRTDYLNTPVSDYDISFKVNTTAPMMICYHFLPAMKERGFGRIVNTTSGIDLEPEQAGYSAAACKRRDS